MEKDTEREYAEKAIGGGSVREILDDLRNRLIAIRKRHLVKGRSIEYCVRIWRNAFAFEGNVGNAPFLRVSVIIIIYVN
jgi:hypothetical protein